MATTNTEDDFLEDDEVMLSDSDLMDPELQAELRALGLDQDGASVNMEHTEHNTSADFELPEGMEDLSKLTAEDLKDESLLADLRELGINPHDHVDPQVAAQLKPKKVNKEPNFTELQTQVETLKREAVNFRRAGDNQNALAAFRKMQAMQAQLANLKSSLTSKSKGTEDQLEGEIQKAKSLALKLNREGNKQQAVAAYQKMQALTKQLEAMKSATSPTLPQPDTPSNPPSSVTKTIPELEKQIQLTKQQAIERNKSGKPDDKDAALAAYRKMTELQQKLDKMKQDAAISDSHIHTEEVEVELTEEDMNDPELLAEMEKLEGPGKPGQSASVNVVVDVKGSNASEASNPQVLRLEEQVAKAKQHAIRLKSIGKNEQALAVFERMKQLEQKLNALRNETRSAAVPASSSLEGVGVVGTASTLQLPECTVKDTDAGESHDIDAAGGSHDMDGSIDVGTDESYDVDALIDDVELSDGDLEDPELIAEMNMLEGGDEGTVPVSDEAEKMTELKAEKERNSAAELRTRSLKAKQAALALQREGRKDEAIESLRLHKQLEQQLLALEAPVNTNTKPPVIPRRPDFVQSSVGPKGSSLNQADGGNAHAVQQSHGQSNNTLPTDLTVEALREKVQRLKRVAVEKQQQGDKEGAVEMYREFKALESVLVQKERSGSPADLKAASPSGVASEAPAQANARLKALRSQVDEAKRQALLLHQQGKKQEAVAMYRKMKLLETHATKLQQATLLGHLPTQGPTRAELLEKLRQEVSKATSLLKQSSRLPQGPLRTGQATQWQEYLGELRAASQVLADPGKPMPQVEVREGDLVEVEVLEDDAIPLNKLRLSIASVSLAGEKLGPGTVQVRYHLGLGTESCYQGQTENVRSHSDKDPYVYAMMFSTFLPAERGEGRKAQRYKDRCAKRKAKFEVWYRPKRSVWTRVGIGSQEVDFQHVGTASVPLVALVSAPTAGGRVPIRLLEGANHEGDEMEVHLNLRSPLDLNAEPKSIKHDRLVINW